MLRTAAERLKNEPALLSGAIIAIVNALMAFGVFEITADQINQLNIAMAAILMIFTRQQVYSKSSYQSLEGELIDQ